VRAAHRGRFTPPRRASVPARLWGWPDHWNDRAKAHDLDLARSLGAEVECLADQDARAQRREREAQRRTESDRAYVQQFAERVRRLYPRCPAPTATAIAEHACAKYSGRVGRSAAAQALDEQAARLAVVAHIRHVETPYDQLLMDGWDRRDARHHVEDNVRAVLARWQ